MLSKRRPTFNSQHTKINKDNQKDMCQYLYGMIQIFMHMLLTKEKDTWQKAPYVSYSIGIDSIVMRDTTTFITGIIENVIEPINSISDMSPVSVGFRRSVKVCSL